MRAAIRILVVLARTLGIVGVFGLAFFDSSLLFAFPGANDLALISFVAAKASWGWAVLAAVLATSGSIMGALVTFRLGRKGGAELLRRRVPEVLRERLITWTRRFGALPVGLAAVLPPPFPYAPFVISAGVMDVPRPRFVLAVAVGRGVRYSLEVALAMVLGRRFTRHMSVVYWTALKILGLLVVVALLTLLVLRLLNPRDPASVSLKD